MMKKIATVGAAAALFLASAVPALAFGGRSFWFHSDDELKVRTYADVNNFVTTSANTGGNKATGSHFGGFRWFGGGENEVVVDGDATAVAEVLSDVNYVEVAGCGCFDDVDIRASAHVNNFVMTSANTGYNMVRRGEVEVDGDADAGSLVTTMVNTILVGGE